MGSNPSRRASRPRAHAARHRLRHAPPARRARAPRRPASSASPRRRDPARRRPDRAARCSRRSQAIGPPVHAMRGNVDSAELQARLPLVRTVVAPARRADRDDPRRRARRRPAGADAPALPGGRRRRLRPLAHAAARGARRLRDLQPGLADRAPPGAAPHDGDRDGRDGRRRARRFELVAPRRGRAARTANLRRPWTSRSSSPAPRAPCRPRGAGSPRSCCARAASGSCSTAARAPSSSCCAPSGCRSSTRSSSPTTTSTTGSAWSGCSRRSTCARASGR